ncbi:uncharacterized mitochondrial protein AtMg00810-like [Lycium barbarum]|uniref:uncharacterized mitochondrial protein AtMg00810-like n=1 Tax=Lycium barbarum TaxID=112863 RepID=UPI00293F32EA|nr:uncharacterized mitochondrial protein AtMg00810-like [Lycium barbarum]
MHITRAIPCKWYIRSSKGLMALLRLERYKARIVIRGDTQKESIDYTKTFSPVVKLTTVKCLLSLAVKRNWTVSSSSSSTPLVCKLKKSLYGLKQASRQWFSKLYEVSRGYISSKNDYSLFTKSSGDSLVVLVVYVDNILLAGSDIAEMTSVKAFLDAQFRIKDLGLVHYFLGLEIVPHSGGYLMNQHKFTSDLLEEFHCSHFTPISSPLDSSLKLDSDVGDLIHDPSSYRRLIGKLNFLQHTRRDISFSIQHLSQFLHCPQVPHVLVALHVLKYLMSAPDLGIVLNFSSDCSLVAFSDSNWAYCPTSRRSVTGFYITLGGCLVSWKCKKQPTIALSSAEAELLGDAGLSITKPVPIHRDSQAAL